MMTDSYLTTATMMIDPLDFEKKNFVLFFFCFFPLLCHERVGCADGTVKKKSCIIFSINIRLLRSGGYIIINLTIYDPLHR